MHPWFSNTPPKHGHWQGNSANQALDRIINFFPEERRQQLLMDLSLNLKSLVSQRLLPRREGKGRVAAVEILINTPLISELVFKGEVGEIKDVMKRSRELTRIATGEAATS